MLGFRGILNQWSRDRTRATIESLLCENIPLYLPVFSDCIAPGCGYDPYLHGARLSTCVVCDGLGRTLTWQTGYVHGRVSWVVAERIINWQGVSSGELGDCAIQGRLRDKSLYELVKRTPDAYFLLNGKRLKPFSIMENRVESITSLDVRCKVITDGKE